MKTRFATLSAIALCLAGSAAAQAPATTPATTAATTTDADPAIWVVKDSDTTIYLFGTIHVLKPGLSWFDEAVKTAFDKSGNVVLEIPLPDPADAAKTQQLVLAIAVAKDGKPLTGKLPEDKRAAYTALLTGFGLPPAALDQFEPWFAAVTLSQLALQRAGFSADQGAEMQLDKAAKAANKPVSGLETLEQQLGFFHDLPESDQIAFLVATVDDAAKFSETIDKLVDRWSHGDPVGLAKLLNDEIEKYPNLNKVLLKDRNTRWAGWIDNRMKQPGTVFIAVGAGHLAGADSVQEQLKPYHLTATRIAY